MLSISSKVALAIGITLSVAAISTIFVTLLAAQNLISSSSGSQPSSQMPPPPPSPPSPTNNKTTTTASSVAGNNTSIISNITIPVGAVNQNAPHYTPNPATVAPSSRVTWINKDSPPHTATAIDGSFDTGIIQPGKSGSAIVPAQGTVPYRCTIHPWMTATLQISSSSSSPSAAGASSSSAIQPGSNGTQ